MVCTYVACSVAKVSLEETAVKLNHLQKVHSKLKDQSDSHAGASVDSLTSYKDIVEVPLPPSLPCSL
jgi:hypothetical protein